MYIAIYSNCGHITAKPFVLLREAVRYADSQFNQLWNAGFHLTNGYRDYTMHFANPLNSDGKIAEQIHENGHWYAWQMSNGYATDSFCCLVRIQV